jgi:hypothetical protein
VGKTAEGKTVLLVTKAGHNDGHHSHADVASLIIAVDGESLVPDPGRGLYSKEYFRQARYDNPFNNSYSHSVPQIGGQLQAPGPEFGGSRQYHGTIIAHGQRNGMKFSVIDFHEAYALPDLRRARRTLELDTETGVITLTDDFEFAAAPLAIEEAFSSWSAVEATGTTARITGERATLDLAILEPEGGVFAVESLEDACRANVLDDTLLRLSVALPAGATRFVLQFTPH